MKRILPLFLIFALLVGCGATTTTAPTDTQNNIVSSAEDKSVSDVSAGGFVINDNRAGDNEVTEPADDPGAEAATYTDADFEVTAEYLYENMFGTSMYFLVVRNNSSATVGVSGNATAKDDAGNMIGAADMSIEVLGPGEESIGYFYFNDVSGISTVDYQLNYSDAWMYQAVLNNLAVEQTLNDGNVTLSITNNGDINAQFVEAYALFMDASGNVVNYASEYFTDNDFEIKPGATISGQLDCYGDPYDHVAVYLVGRSDGSASEAGASGYSDADFEITEYLYENMFGTSMYFLAIKNHSSAIVSISGNATAKDSAGNTIGAANMSIDILAPGEESIGYFYFNDVSGIDSVDYQLMYSDEPFYEPVISNLAIEASVNDSNVVITATNNGDIAAKFVEAYVLFFDSDGNVAGYDSSYITDDDNEIKPGATLSTQANIYESFDHVEVYLTGRGGGF